MIQVVSACRRTTGRALCPRSKRPPVQSAQPYRRGRHRVMDNNNHTFSSWLRSPAHHQWLALEGNRLLAFAKASRLENGFGSLDDYGRLMVGATAETM
ncbi:Uncharacterized protein ALO94_01193, partial [Pseudomonas syringae pv. spinaceae]